MMMMRRQQAQGAQAALGHHTGELHACGRDVQLELALERKREGTLTERRVAPRHCARDKGGGSEGGREMRGAPMDAAMHTTRRERR